MPPPLTISGGQFKGLLGRGGTAEVSRWSRDMSVRPLACKYPLTNTPQDLEQFSKLAKREWDLVGGWCFPGIVRLVSHGKEFEYLLMELCEGPSLDSLSRIPPASALAILSSITATLSAIHARGIVHCDIKPQNIFLPADWATISRGDKHFYSRLSDFSLGRFLTEPESSRAGIGTVGYAAPETVRHGLTSIQSDLFSLGVVAWQLFAGCHPFIADDEDMDPVAISSRVSEQHPTPLCSLNPDCDERLSDLVTSLLAKNPHDRPSSAWEVCGILEAIGSTFPTRKAIAPRHIVNRNDLPEKIIESLVVNQSEASWLTTISNNDGAILTAILDENHRKDRLRFDGASFAAAGYLTWPSRMRRQILNRFASLSLAEKKQAVVRAVSSASTPFAEIDYRSSEDSGTSQMLLHLLHHRTVRRLSLRAAQFAKQRGAHAVAARLFVQAGKPDEAIIEAREGARDYRAGHHIREAVALLQHVIRYAELSDNVFPARDLLMLLGDIFKQAGQADEAMTEYRRIVTLYEGHPPDHLLAECYKDIGDICKMKRSFHEGIEALNQALAIYESLNDELEISHTQNNLGNIYWVKPDFRRGTRHHRIALRIQRRLGVAADVASTLNNIGASQVMQGRFRRSILLFEHSLKIARELGNQGEIARTLNNLGYTYHVLGQPSRAADMLRESLEINRRIGSKKEVLYNMENLTQVMIGAGQLSEAIPLLDEGTSLALEIGDTPHRGTILVNRGLVSKRLGDFGSAEAHFGSAEAIAKSLDSSELKLSLLTARAGLRFAIGDRTQATALASSALAMAIDVNDRPSRLNAIILLTRAADELNLFEDGVELARELGLQREARLLRAWRLDSRLESGKPADDFAPLVLADIDAFNDDLEQSAVLCIIAAWFHRINKLQEADGFARQAHMTASQHALLPEEAEALHMRGQISCSLGDVESGFLFYREALGICKRLSESFTDSADRDLYLNQPWILNLFGEIRRLGSLLGNKKGQVVA